ncbi:hypothetical protein [Jiulongibacter sediminis]|jgi:hypothetical protein|uniref:hypothetical protein n=1 Tax=Jiulongibacter sediminis TaxID=1605367 RepID=UPI0026ECA956|nr:hypothetical protein [Jiulongibacter sediminis]
MNLFIRLLAVIGIILSSISGFSQHATIEDISEIMVVDPELNWEVNWPLERQVFQQNNSEQAAISIAGQFSHSTSSSITIEYSIDNLSLQTGAVTGSYSGWSPITSLINLSGKNEKVFLQDLTLPKGWYRLNLRAKYGSTVWGPNKNIKFGVGDIYIIAGQSNAAGYEWNSDPETDDTTLQPFPNYSGDSRRFSCTLFCV